MMPPHRLFNILSHAVAGVLMLAGTPGLYRRARSRAARRAVLTFSLSNAATFAVSSAYHASRSTEDEAAQRTLEKADHAGIFAAVAGAYTPLVATCAPRAARQRALLMLWSLALGGMGLQALNVKQLPRWGSSLMYLLLGTYGLRLLPQLHLPDLARRWMLLGQLLTALGALVYKKRQPDPWPRLLGAHGLWHLLSAFGSFALYLAVRNALNGERAPRR